MKKNIKLMLKDLCCSRCKSDFDENSVEFIHKEKDFNVVHLTCQNCGKDFGISFFKINKKSSRVDDDIILRDTRNTPPINYDDVLNAHEYIKDIEKNWKHFIKEDF